MARNEKAVFKWTADTSAIDAALDRTRAKAEGAVFAGGRLTSVFGGLKVAAVAGAAGVGALGAALLNATKMADVQIRAQKGLEQAIQSTGSAISAANIKRLAADLQSVTTFGDEATLVAARMLVQFNATEKQIEALLPLTQDLAASFGVDLTAATKAVGQAINGKVGALSRYGVVLSATEEQVFKLASQEERAAIITEKLTKTVGGSAQLQANTAVGAFTQMKNAVGDAQEEVGKLIDRPLASYFQQITARVVQLTPLLGKLALEFLRISGAETKTDVRRVTERHNDMRGFLEGHQRRLRDLLQTGGVTPDATIDDILGDQLGDVRARTDPMGTRRNRMLTDDERATIQERLLSLQESINIETAQFEDTLVRLDENAKKLAKSLTGDEGGAGSGGAVGGVKKVKDELIEIDEAFESNLFGMDIEESTRVFNERMEEEGKALRLSLEEAARDRDRARTEMLDADRAAAKEQERIARESAKEQERIHKDMVDAKAAYDRQFNQQMQAMAMGMVWSAVSAAEDLLEGLITGQEHALEQAAIGFARSAGSQLIAAGVSGVAQGVIHSANPLAPGSGAGMIAAGVAAIATGGALKAGGVAGAHALAGGSIGQAIPSSGGGGLGPSSSGGGAGARGPVVINITQEFGVAGPQPDVQGRYLVALLDDAARRGLIQGNA